MRRVLRQLATHSPHNAVDERTVTFASGPTRVRFLESILGHCDRPLVCRRRLVPTTTLILADDNRAVLEHVRKMLTKSNRFEVLAAYTDGASVLDNYDHLKPDVVVLDISMGDLSGIDVARQLRDAGCDSKIIFLTVHEDFDFMNAAMGAGGSAYVVKSRLSTDLISAINAVLSNKLFVSATLLAAGS